MLFFLSLEEPAGKGVPSQLMSGHLPSVSDLKLNAMILMHTIWASFVLSPLATTCPAEEVADC